MKATEVFRLACGSGPMQRLLGMLDRAAAAPYPVLVTGESGTGKELVARALHRRSPRAAGPFVAANAAALTATLVESELFGHERGAFTGADRDRAGLFEQARGGTLFLDEVACLPPAAQESLLRVLETGEYRPVGASRAELADVRLVAATHAELAADPRFRRDLYYRLDVLRLELPPLRDRLEDLPELCERLLLRIAAETGRPAAKLAPGAFDVLRAHRWPGNVRELVNALRRASVAGGETLGAADFGFLADRPRPRELPLLALDDYIRGAVEAYEGRLDLGDIADRLGMSRKSLWERRRRWKAASSS
jgi:DNA-binding NtrC family response regulator